MLKFALYSAQCAAMAAALMASASSAAVYTATASTYNSVIQSVKGGDTLKLIGTFSGLRLQNHSYSSLVTIDASRATFTDFFNLTFDDNVKVSGGKWNISSSTPLDRAIIVYGGSNIWLDKISVTGIAGQQGVNMLATTNAKMTNSTFSGLQVAVGIGELTGATVLNNKIYHSVSDGIDIGDSHNVVASYNSCSAGNPGLTAHPDCIQLWSTTGHPTESDITVTHNSASGKTQGFTSFSSGGGALRVNISYNSVKSSMPQGVACYDCWDSTISYNHLTTLPDAQHLTNLNIVGGGNNNVVGNIIDPAPWLRREPDFVAPDWAPAFDAAMNDVQPVVSGGLSFADLTTSGSAAAVPEPATWAMLLTGFAAVGLTSRRRTPTVCA